MSWRIPVIDSLDAMLYGSDTRKLRIGLAMPMSGVLGLTGPTMLDAVSLAAHELNRQRGTHARPIEFVIVDSGKSAAAVATEVAQLAERQAVEAFVGLHTSYTLEYIEGALGASIPYIFAPGHEGLNRLPGYYCSGETPKQAGSGLRWLMMQRSVQDWAIVGTDYVWPRAARAAERDYIERFGGRVVQDKLVQMGSVDRSAAPLIDDVIASGAQGVIINMPGRDLVTVLRAIRARGLDNLLVRFSPGTLDENVLYALDGDSSGNLYSSMHSFHSLRTDRREELNDRHRSVFGPESPVLTSWGEHAYDGVHLLARLDEAGLLDAMTIGTPRGIPAVQNPGLAQPQYQTHLAVAVGANFQVLDVESSYEDSQASPPAIPF